MGVCTSRKLEKEPQISKSPGIQHTFKIVFSNIKVKNLPFNNAAIEFKAGTLYYKTQPIEGPNPHWKEKFQGVIKTSLEAMESEIFYITVLNKETVFATLSLNMKEIATGPAHFDMFLAKSRITFYLKMVQRVALIVTTKQVSCELKDQLMEQTYSFQFRIRSNNLDYQSDLSPIYLNPYLYRQHKESKQRSDSDDFQLFYNKDDASDEEIIALRKSKSSTQIPKLGQSNSLQSQSKRPTMMDLCLKKDFSWEFKMQEDSPQISFEIFVDEFAASSFEFMLWSDSSTKHDMKIVGHSIISMNKFCSDNVSMLAQLDAVEVKEVEFINKLWHQGRQIGNVKGLFIIKNDPYITQMLGGFRTEEGIQRASLLYIKKDKYNGADNRSIQQIIQINMQMDDLIGKINQKNLPHREKVKLNAQINQITVLLNEVLRKQELYQNEDELIRAQQVLTDLSKNLLESADSLDEYLREQYYEMLVTLLNRDEFFISYLGFNTQTKVEQKIRIGLHYQNFLHQTLEKAVSKLKQRVQNEKEQNFVNYFFVIAYFRIPQVQQQILTTLQNDIRTLPDPFEIDSSHIQGADWDKNFYQYLQGESRYHVHMAQLNIILNSINWEEIIFGSHIILKWISLMIGHLRKARPLTDITLWSTFPGYSLLFRHVLLEIRYCQQMPYPQEIRDASKSLLENAMVLNQLVIVIFHKTRLYDGVAVFFALDMIMHWFEVLRKNQQKVPPDFNYQFLLKGLFMILDGQHCLSLAKVIQLIYSIFPQLPVEIQKDICDYMLDTCFFKCFIFWSKLVRWVYMHFLIYRIQHRLRNFKSEQLRDVMKEFESIKLQKNVHTVLEKQMLLNNLIYIKYTQLIEIALKMKKVLNDKPHKNELEGRSLKLKLFKKKLKKKQFESPNHDSQIEFKLQQQKSVNSLTFSLQDPIYQSNENEEESSVEPSDYSRSLGSIIDLDAIFNELKKESKAKHKHKTRNQSADISSSLDDENDKNIIVYRKMGEMPQIAINRELIRYLLAAMSEWQEQQALYKRWFQQQLAMIRKKKPTAEEENRLLIDLDPPEIKLYVPKDESETDQEFREP